MKRNIGLVVGLSVCMALAGCDRGTGHGGATPVLKRPGAVSTTEGARCWLDKLNDEAIARNGSVGHLAAGQPFGVAGWLVDGEHHAADSMRLVLTPVAGGDARRFPAVMGVVRVDVAEALHEDAAKTAGFTVQGNADQLAPGRYNVTAKAKSGSHDLQCDFNVVFDVSKAD